MRDEGFTCTSSYDLNLVIYYIHGNAVEWWGPGHNYGHLTGPTESLLSMRSVDYTGEFVVDAAVWIILANSLLTCRVHARHDQAVI